MSTTVCDARVPIRQIHPNWPYTGVCLKKVRPGDTRCEEHTVAGPGSRRARRRRLYAEVVKAAKRGWT